MFLRFHLEILCIINFLKITFILSKMAMMQPATFNMASAANHLYAPQPMAVTALTELSG